MIMFPVNPAAPVFIFLGMTNLVLCVAPDIKLVAAGGLLTTALALLTWLKQ
jgi:hypothetical protein